jgi:4-diphosphocytidyl-2-C-methyl-D-erythritol kinase
MINNVLLDYIGEKNLLDNFAGVCYHYAMENIVYRNAYAKINLHLAVGFPDKTGYHSIVSVFSKVDLFDTLTVSWEKSPCFSIEVHGLGQYCKSGTDTLTKAAFLWFEKSGYPLSLVVGCEKRIPVKAGLGGGSSDAAALLDILQEIAGPRALDKQTLDEVGRKVGSDVAFFLSGFASALVRGKGEIVEELAVPAKEVLLVMPSDFDISTAEAYNSIDENRADGFVFGKLDAFLLFSVFLKDCSVWGEVLYNDFCPCIGHRDFYDKLKLLSLGCAGYGNLTGSGACWFFLSENRQTVLNLQSEIDREFGSGVRMWLAPLLQ